jgi:hypothetical protein
MIRTPVPFVRRLRSWHTRGYFVYLLFLLSALAATTIANGQVVAPRENIRTFSSDPQKVDKLRRAVEVIQSRGFDDATSWFNMAGIHDFPADDPNRDQVPQPIQDLWQQCHNDDSLFFLWHRAYVWSMERLMQDAISDTTFRLPYWDWYRDPKLPEIFRNEFVDDQQTKKNPLYRKDRNRGVNAGNDVWRPVVVTDYTNASFFSFQDDLNFSEHGTIHVAVGTRTNMGGIQTAARDPIFWLHHANIDRLLQVWLQADQNGHKVPADFPNWLPSKYRFPTTNGELVTPTVQQLALDSMQALGYTYEEVQLPTVPSPTVPVRPRAVEGPTGEPTPMGPGLTALSIKRGLEIGPAGTVELAVPSTERDNMLALGSGKPHAGFSSVVVVLKDVKLLHLPERVLSYQLFLNLPEAETANENFRNYYLGSISLFALQGHHASVELRFPATELISKLNTRTNVAPSKISISLVPVLEPEASAPAEPILSIGEIRLEAARTK